MNELDFSDICIRKETELYAIASRNESEYQMLGCVMRYAELEPSCRNDEEAETVERRCCDADAARWTAYICVYV